MGYNRIFFPQAALDAWIADDRVELHLQELVIKAEGRRYSIEEAVRVLEEVSGAADVHQVVGKVKPREALEFAGAELFDTSMILGDNAYEVVPGWLGLPIGSFDAHLSGTGRRRVPSLSGEAALALSASILGASGPVSSELRDAQGALVDGPASDEDLLASFLMRNLE